MHYLAIKKLVFSCWSEWPSLKSPQITNAGEPVEKREPSYTVDGNVSWCSHCGKQYGSSSKETKNSYHMIQSLEKAMATHSSTLAWKIPWVEEPGRLQSTGLLGVGHDWVTSLSLFTFIHWRRERQPTPVFLPGESQGRGSLVGCRLWGRTESEQQPSPNKKPTIFKRMKWNELPLMFTCIL